MEELKEIGLIEVMMDDNGYVMVIFLVNMDKDVFVIGFLVYLDMVIDFIGKNVKL